MPYIPLKDKERLNKNGVPDTPGELTYVLYKTCLDYVNRHGPASFELYACVLGSLSATVQELYRRRIAPYEDQKIIQNGDIA